MLDEMLEKLRDINHKVACFIGDEKGNASSTQAKSSPIKIEPHFLSQALPYDIFDDETSLFINKKSIGFVLETTPLLGSGEEKENILASIIVDIIPDYVDVQFLLFASPKIEPFLTAFENARVNHETIHWLAKQRTDYLRGGVSESLSGSGALMLRNFRTFIVISMKKKQTDAKGELLGLREDIQSSLKSVNISSQTMSAQSFITTFFDIITPSQTLTPHDEKWNEYDSLSQQMINPEWCINIKPNYLQFSGINEEVQAHAFSVRDYPKYATQWKVTENLGQFFNETLQIPCPFLVSFSVRKVNQSKASSEAQINTMNRESNAKSPLAKFQPSIKDEYNDWNFIRTRLSEGDAIVKTFYQIILFAKPEKAKLCERRVRDLYRANGWVLRKESYLQFQAWLAALPFMMTEGLFEDFKHFGRLRTMTAFNAINVAPLQGEWKGSRTPGILIPGRRGQVALWSPFDNEGGNYNIAIAASPGKGKSVLVEEMIMSILGAKGQVQVIDQGHSQQKICKFFGGQFIECTQHTPICLNPFSSITDINESIVMLKTMVASMARPLRGVSDEEMSYIEQGIKGAFEREGYDASISEVSRWLLEQKSDICKNLSHLLYSYTKEGSYAKFFEGKCSIDFQNPFIVLELQDLKSKAELRKIVLQLIIYQISQKMYQGDRTQIKSCIIDEAWDLFDDDNVASAKFIETGYRTARKFRGNFVSIAHSYVDFYKNPMSRAAFSCSDYKISLGQSEEAINKIKEEKIIDMNEFTERIYKSLKTTKDYSEFVIKGPEGMSLHRLILDPYSRILYSTKGEEFDAVNHWMAQGLSLIQAVERAARQFNHV